MHIQAILFDLHHTLTGTKITPIDLFRQVATAHGIDIRSASNAALQAAFSKSDEWFKEYQLTHNVDLEHGSRPEHWLEPDRIVYEELGFSDLDDDLILEIEKEWMHATGQSDWEYLTPESRDTLVEMNRRGYVLGICTRRTHNPRPLLERENIDALFATVRWTGVVGYSKPSPFTLLQAADEIGINPRRIAFVGNYVNADIEAAMRAEMLPVLLTWANPGEAKKAPNGTLVMGSPLELLDVFMGPKEPIILPR
ncbi:MAG: HAD family hydrolase [Candidatus Thorarchaeota archaeon]|nr:HAD family hydrolase [Candidatus Thorarchaeota archaeon]